MKNRLLPFLILLILISTIIFSIILKDQKTLKPDTVRLNELRIEVESSKDDYNQIDNLNYNIIVIDTTGNILYSTEEREIKSYEEWLNYAYQNNGIIIDFSEGKIIVLQPESRLIEILILSVSIFAATLILTLIIYNIYINKSLFTPFRNLENFAGEVAIGNFDKPLPMDRRNLFGAFSESFDIMRLELKKAKDKEIELEKSKKELVAELSHDIKTPIASIRAVAELLGLNETDLKKQKNIKIIEQKVKEIDNLISDLFNSALQDLSELKIKMDIISSKDIKNKIIDADYLNQINEFDLPDCYLDADLLRVSQIIGNIINNSYKYAKTSIVINSEVINKFLSIEFCDFGPGVSDDEIPYLTNQYFRGKNSEKNSGAGLGLYICKLILEKMDGSIDCYNTKDGFAVKIFLKLV